MPFNFLRVGLLAVLLSSAACASDDPTNGASEPSTADDDAGAKDAGAKDAGKKDAGSVSTPDTGVVIAPRDAGTTPPKDAGAKDAGTISSIDSGADGDKDKDSGPMESLPGDAAAGAVTSCENLVCFDVFDCAIWHIDSINCGFTSCDGFVCKK
jgi:hypothetical protein